ncbi:MAG TPA: hypothetical protein PKX00_14040 [Opitutaceae bacterium]|nr:hypothetical protein [Opitutaceae bacterium]
MPLKLTVTDLGEVAEPMRGAYRPRNDGSGFILDVEGGAVAKSVHDEFRTRNVELMKRLKEVEGADPGEVARLREENATLQADLEKTRSGKNADVEARIKAVTLAADTYRTRLEALTIDGAITRVAGSVGALPGAIDDVSTRIRARFKLGEDGQPVAVDTQGNKIYGEDGHPLSIEGAVRQLTKQAPHLFKASSGSGASNGPSGAGGRASSANPWAKGSWNVTEQMRALKADPQAAAQLKSEAGVFS